MQSHYFQGDINMPENNIVLFTSNDEDVSLSVSFENETVWLSLD